MPWLLAAFVGGVFVLQRQAALPSFAAIVVCLLLALPGMALALRWVARATTVSTQRTAFGAAALCVGVAGFAYAAGVAARCGWPTSWRSPTKAATSSSKA